METYDSMKEFDQSAKPPKNNMTMAVVGTIIGLCSPCCIGLIVGIIGIVFASGVNGKFMSGDHMGAQSSAKTAKTLGIIALVLGIIGIIFNIVTIATMGGIQGYMDYVQSIVDQYQLGN